MRRWTGCAVILLLAACSGTDDPNRAASGSVDTDERYDLARLVDLYESRDYFALRERLGEPVGDEPPEVQLLRAALLHSFNEPERSNAVLALLLREPALSDSLRYEARMIRLRNDLRLHRYASAGAVLDSVLEKPPAVADSSALADLRNMSRLTRALEAVPPQRVASRAATSLSRVERGHVQVTIGDSVRDYAIDTGANFSFLIESEAELLGLDVRPAGLDVGTSTDARVTANLAVADRMEIGGIELQNVVFLVFPDEMFTFPGLVIRGIIGFPVLEALGELRFRKGGPIEIPAEVPEREVRNLALHQLTPLVEVGYGDDELLCRFDTGANTTEFYEPFYRRYRDRVEAEGAPDTVRTGGAGGIRELPGYRMQGMNLGIGGATVTLPESHVHTRVLTRTSEENDLYCNVGLDMLADFEEYILNFRSMSLVLR